MPKTLENSSINRSLIAPLPPSRVGNSQFFKNLHLKAHRVCIKLGRANTTTREKCKFFACLSFHVIPQVESRLVIVWLNKSEESKILKWIRLVGVNDKPSYRIITKISSKKMFDLNPVLSLETCSSLYPHPPLPLSPSPKKNWAAKSRYSRTGVYLCVSKTRLKYRLWSYS